MKFFLYRSEIESLTDYVLVSQDSVFIEHYEKQADGRWVHNVLTSLDDILRLASIECEIPVREIYERVEFAEETAILEEQTV
jgi:hypothetical protein